jgi:hypothetical protein
MAIRLPYPYPDPTQQWDAYALLRNLQFLATKITDIQAGQIVPTAAVLMVVSGTTCPDGYTKLSLANGSYLRISTGTAGGTGGSLSVSIVDSGHTHAVNTNATTSGAPSSTVVVASGAGTTVATGTHTHVTDAATVASSSATTGVTGTIAPSFLDVILCQKS